MREYVALIIVDTHRPSIILACFGYFGCQSKKERKRLGIWYHFWASGSTNSEVYLILISSCDLQLGQQILLMFMPILEGRILYENTRVLIDRDVGTRIWGVKWAGNIGWRSVRIYLRLRSWWHSLGICVMGYIVTFACLDINHDFWGYSIKRLWRKFMRVVCTSLQWGLWSRAGSGQRWSEY